jgi:hypothetical protein
MNQGLRWQEGHSNLLQTTVGERFDKNMILIFSLNSDLRRIIVRESAREFHRFGRLCRGNSLNCSNLEKGTKIISIRSKLLRLEVALQEPPVPVESPHVVEGSWKEILDVRMHEFYFHTIGEGN